MGKESLGRDLGPRICSAMPSGEPPHRGESCRPGRGLNVGGELDPAKDQLCGDVGCSLALSEVDEVVQAATHLCKLEAEAPPDGKVLLDAFP